MESYLRNLRVEPAADKDEESHGCRSCWTILLSIITLYLFLAVLANLIACYKFVAAWTFISRTHRVDRQFLHRRPTRQRSWIDATSMKQHWNCPICLEDFYEQDQVTCCDDGGCGQYYHCGCLAEWLDRADTCPCCRHNLVVPRPRGWMADLSIYLGYSPRRY